MDIRKGCENAADVCFVVPIRHYGLTMPAVPLVRTSERSSFTRCHWAWERGYVECIKPKVESPPLRFGTLIHRALERYYQKGKNRGMHPAKTFERIYRKELKEYENLGFRDDDGEWNDAFDLGVAMLNGYIEHYGEKDSRWLVLATEMPFKVPVLHPKTGDLLFRYTGVIDLVVKDRETGFVGMVDHKTTREDPTNVGYLNLDEQAGAYWRYGRQALYDSGMLRHDRELNGIIFNFLKKSLPDDRPKNKEGQALNLDGSVSKRQQGPLFYRAAVWRNDAEGESVHQRVLEQYADMRAIRKGMRPAYKSPGKMTCGGCGYRDICELHESKADWETARDAIMETWDPYAVHETENAEKR